MKKIKIIYLFILSLVLIGCSSNVNIEIFRFVNHEIKIQVGETVNLDLILGEYPEDSKVIYTFDNDNIIDFENGVATGKAVGEVIVTATVDNIKFATTKVVVNKIPIDAMQIKVSKTKMFVDEKLQFSVEVIPSDHSNEVTWSIDLGNDVGEITQDGILSAKRGEENLDEYNAGGAKVRVVATSKEDPEMKAKIEILVQYRKTSSVTITVPDNITEFTLEQIVNKEVESIQTEVGILPLTANSIVTYTSNNTGVALVNAEGLITFPETPKAGVAVITVRTIDNVSASITITITEPEPEPEPDPDPELPVDPEA